MTMPSAKKLLLCSGFPDARPFAVSGSWENGSEGWFVAAGFERSTSPSPRSGAWGYVQRFNPNNTQAQLSFRLAASSCRGLLLKISVYSKGSATRIEFARENVPGIQIVSTTSATGNFALSSGSALANIKKSKWIDIYLNTFVVGAQLDDWSIEGTKP